MRRTTATTPRRWRHRRAARIALATALVVAAPFVGTRDHGNHPAPTANGEPAATGASTSTYADVEGAGSGGDGGGDSPGEQPRRVVPVPLADATVADVLRPGDLVDLVAVHSGPADQPGPGPVVVARAVRIRGTPDGRGGTRSILVEVPEPEAAPLAATAAGTPLAVIVHG